VPEMKNLWSNYNLSVVLAILFLLSLAMQTFMGWQVYANEQAQHGAVAQLFGSDGYIWQWGEATFENWQSEFLQLLTFVFLTSFLIHKGSHESKDGDEEIKSTLQDITKRLDKIEEISEQLPNRRRAS
jgi:hypothetical protein